MPVSPATLPASRAVIRTIRGALNDQGSGCYNELLEQTRGEMAVRFVRSSDMPISETAFLLGFSGPPNFPSAFHRWHGLPPSVYRHKPV